MFMAQIKNLAGDFTKTHRWCLVNLTGDDANAENRQQLSQRRVIGIGRRYVKVMANNGQINKVEPFLIQRVW